MAPVVATTLNDLPEPFINNGVFDANIIVGSSGTAAGISSDLAGAMDVAASFAQQAITPKIEGVEGITPARINGTTGHIGYGDVAINQEHVNDWMLNETFDDYELTEKIRILNNGGATLNKQGVFNIDFGALQYEINSNETLQNGQDISLFGTSYKITEIIPNNKIVFGEINTETNVELPTVITIPDKATISITDVDTVTKDVKVTVISDNGTVMFNDFIANDAGKIFEDYGFGLSNFRMLSTGKITLNVDWTNSLTTLEHNGNASIISEDLNDWRVIINDDSIKFNSPQYKSGITLNEGDSVTINDYFTVKFENFDENDYTTINAYNIQDNSFSVSLRYEDVNNDIKEVYLGSYEEQNFKTNGLTDYLILSDIEDVFRFSASQNSTDRYVEVFRPEDDLTEPYTTLFNTTDSNSTTFNINNAVYELTWTDSVLNATLQNWEITDSKYSNIKFNNNALTVTENNDVDTIVINYADNSINEEETNEYTNFGTHVLINEQATLTLPEVRRTANVWYGRSVEEIEESGGELVPVSGKIGAVDTEITTLTKPAIIVGGGLSNSWTQTLADNNETIPTTELLSREGTAYIQLIENALGSEQTVLIVAGRDAMDTRLASKVLSRKVIGLNDFDLNDDLVWLDTSNGLYETVKVIQ